ncbi:MAG: ansB2, partial [Anaerocolumna sp.]|nr:ansB2 [Anaerocolumna sp.]
ALCPYIGYQKAASLAKKSLENNIPLKELVILEDLLESKELENILNPIAMTTPNHYEEKTLINL